MQSIFSSIGRGRTTFKQRWPCTLKQSQTKQVTKLKVMEGLAKATTLHIKSGNYPAHSSLPFFGIISTLHHLAVTVAMEGGSDSTVQ